MHDVYFLPIIQLIKPRKMRWAGHIAHMWGGGGMCIQDFSGKNLTERDHMEDIGMDGY